MTVRPPDGSAEPVPRIGYWSRSNLAIFGERLRPLVFEAEMRRRLPRAQIHAYAPLGPRHGAARGEGPAPAELGAWSPARLAELADALDCVVIGGEDAFRTSNALLSSAYGGDADEVSRTRPSSFFIEGLGPELERRAPVAWDAIDVPTGLDKAGADRVREALAGRPYLSVRDPESRERLLGAGVQTPITVVPDPVLLAPRTFAREVLSRRVGFIRYMEWFPREGEPLVIQGDNSLSKAAETIADVVAGAAASAGAPVVLLELDSDDGVFLDAVARVLPVPVFRVPREAALVDRVAVLAHARAFVGSSRAGVTVASAFGTPVTPLESTASADLAASLERGLSTPRGPAGPRPEDEKRLDAHFDALAGVAERAFVARLRESGDPVPRLLHRLTESERRLEAWRAAWEARSDQVVQGRLEMAAILEKRVAEAATRHPAELAALEAELAGAAAEVARRRAEHEEARERIRSLEKELESARKETTIVCAEAERKTGRAQKAAAELRAELERAEARLDRLRAEQAEFRVTQTLLFTELAEARRSGKETD